METNEIKKKSTQIRQLLNERRFSIGESISLSIIQIISLFVINISLAAIVLNLFIKGNGTLEWWSGYVAGVLVFLYLILRIFTSSGVVLGRQVTLLITVFNLFLNLFKTFNIVQGSAVWELSFVIPLVNLLCMLFLIIAFIIRKKKFRTIIMPSSKLIFVSIIPIVRLKIRLGDDFYLPIFATLVLILAVALFLNSLIFNWLNIRKEAEKNFAQLKKSAIDFKKAGDKVAAINKSLENLGQNVNKAKSFVHASTSAVKEFFTFKKKPPMPAIEITGEPISILNEPQPEEPKVIEFKEKKSKSMLKQVLELNIVKKAAELLKKKPRKQDAFLLIENGDESALVLSDIENDIELVGEDNAKSKENMVTKQNKSKKPLA